ncbi:MAG: DNRLRE domain-containing protein [Nitrospirae bacterium]|nr:DNRLRE domain-containing protein [Candidatus Manganitrophaceae bacterium]
MTRHLLQRLVAAFSTGVVAVLSSATLTTAADPSPLTAAATIMLTPTADTYLDLNASVNSGGETLSLYTWPDHRIANAALMKFDVSGIVPGAVIQSATLTLSLVSTDTKSDPTYMVTVHKILHKNPDLSKATGSTYDGVNAWSASGCCNDNIPMAQGDISAAYDRHTVDQTRGNKSWNIRTMVQEWVNNPSTNYGLLLNPDPTKPADHYRTFASMEHPAPSRRPSLQIIYSVANPGERSAPTGLTAKAGSASQIVLNWNPSTNSVGLAGYRVYRNGIQIGTTALTLYSDTGLEASTTYRYSISAYDASGMVSEPSAAVSATTLAPPDTTAPVISGMMVSDITGSDATIRWTTNEPADTQVEYGTTATYGAFTSIVTAPATAHTQRLTGLSPSTLYHFRARSRDAAGNPALSGDGTFTTAALADTTAPSIPTALTASAISASQIVLSWTASTDNVSVSGYRVYRNGTLVGTTPWVGYKDTGLAPSTTYHYSIAAYDAAENASAQAAAVSVTTPAPPDITPPLLSGIGAKVTPTGLALLWTTDEPATSQIEYGTTTTYGMLSTFDPALVLSHQVTLNDLKGATTYHYRIISQDTARNKATSGDNTFTTALPPDVTPPSLSDITAGEITLSSAVVRWTTDELADTQIEYGATPAYGFSTPMMFALMKRHSQNLTGLLPSTRYHYRVKSRDGDGNLAVSPDATFTTASPPDTIEPSMPTGLTAVAVSPTQITVAWNPSTDNIGVAGYRLYRNGLLAATLNSQIYSDTLLEPDAAYRYTVAAYDAAGNLSALSAPATTHTPPLR